MANVIADIAGNYKTLMALLKKMPDDEPISLGDMVDRGPRSKEVLEFFMSNGRAILGNHEHMMLDACRKLGYYQPDVWCWNGGDATLKSFGAEGDYVEAATQTNLIPDEVLDWVAGLPLYLEENECILSHSFVDVDLESSCKLGSNAHEAPHSIIWSRWEPQRIDAYDLQIAGHNSQFGYRRWSDDKGEYAICLDACREKLLTGVHLPSKEIFQQEYID